MADSITSFNSLYYNDDPGRLLRRRRHLDHSPATTPPGSSGMSKYFDSNAITIVAVLLCAVICALLLNSIVRCVLRCTIFNSDRRGSSNGEPPSGGVKKKALESMVTLTYTDGAKLPGSECAICLSEFGVGERVTILPKCNHGFHVGCIDKWLEGHSSCPMCRRCLSTNGGCHPRAVVINPLDPEDPFINYRV